jgi:hypothetical protein
MGKERRFAGGAFSFSVVVIFVWRICNLLVFISIREFFTHNLHYVK